jgi:hypothetical protein
MVSAILQFRPPVDLSAFEAFPDVGYKPELKEIWGRDALKIARWIMKSLGPDPEWERPLRWNRAGIAVSGEVILYSGYLAVWIGQSCVNLPTIMYRWENRPVRNQHVHMEMGHNQFCAAYELPEKLVAMQRIRLNQTKW